MVLYTPSTGEIEAERDFVNIGDVAKAVRKLGQDATFGVLEFVSARPGQGVTSMFHFGQAAGVPVGVMETIDLPWIDVVPQTWQRWVKEFVGLEPKQPFLSAEVALQCSREEYHHLFKRSKDHNTADAYFLALWGAVHAYSRPKASGGNCSQSRLPLLERMLEKQAARRPF